MSENVRYNVRGGDGMSTTTSITALRKNLYSLIDSAVRFNEPINVVTKSGNAVIISEEEYKSLMETVHLLSIPGMKEKLLKGKATPVEDCVAEDEVKW